MYTLMKADVLAQLAGLQQEISQLHDNAQQNQSHFVLLERRFSRLQSFNDEPQLQDYRLQLEHDDAVVNKLPNCGRSPMRHCVTMKNIRYAPCVAHPPRLTTT